MKPYRLPGRVGRVRDSPRDGGATSFFWIFHPWRNYDFLRNLLVDRRHVVTAIAVMKDSDDRAVSTDDGANNAAFGTTVGADRANLYQHAVPMHCRTDSGWGNENISGELGLQAWVEGSGIGSDKPVAVAMHAQLSDQNVFARGGLRNCVTVRVDLNQLAAAHKTLQAIGEFVACVAMKPQFAHQLLEASHALRLAFDLLEDGGIGESVQDRGWFAAQTIILRCGCRDGFAKYRRSITRDCIETGYYAAGITLGSFPRPCISRLRKGLKVQKAQNFHKTWAGSGSRICLVTKVRA